MPHVGTDGSSAEQRGDFRKLHLAGQGGGACEACTEVPAQAWRGVRAAVARTPSGLRGCLFCRLRLDRSQPGVVEAHPGQRIQLPCRAEGFPPPTIEWQRDGQPPSSPRFVQLLSLLSCLQAHLPRAGHSGKGCQVSPLVSQGLLREGAAQHRAPWPDRHSGLWAFPV